MVFSEQWNGRVAYKAQTGLGVAAGGTGGKILRTTGGQGGRLSKQAIESIEVRQDALSTRGRHGTQRTNGQYTGEYSVGAIDDMLAAVMRGSWSAANVTITQSTPAPAMTSITIPTTHTIVAAAGSWITAGISNGDVIRLSNTTKTENNNRNLRVSTVTATTLTVVETLTVDAVPDTSFSVVRTGRTLVNPLAGFQAKTYYTFEDYEYGIDASEVFQDIIIGSVGITCAPDALVQWTINTVGTGKFSYASGVSSPVLTAPVQSIQIPMAATEMVVRIGTDVTDITSFDIGLDLQATAPPTLGVYAPDVFQGSLVINMNMTFLRQDLNELMAFAGETQQTAQILIAETGAEPRDFLSIYIPNFTFGSVDKSALAKAGGPRTQSVSVPSALIGIDERGGSYDQTMIKFQVSNAI